MKTLLEEMQAQADCKEYTAWNGKKCYRTFGNLAWYVLKCNQYELEPKQDGDFHYTAKGNGFEFEYCEHDIIYAVG